MKKTGREIPLEGKILWLVSAAAVIVIPLCVDPQGHDSFRLPKSLLLHAAGILLATVMALGAVWNGRRSLAATIDLRSAASVVVLLIVAWSGVTALLSTHRFLSARSFLWVVSAALLFFALVAVLPGKSFRKVLMIGLAPALLNAALAIAQELGWFNPFWDREMISGPARRSMTTHWATVGFLGNANDVGTYLAPALICAIAAAFADRAYRAAWTTAAALIAGGVAASQTLGSYVALTAGLVAFCFFLSKRAAIAIASVLAAALLLSALVPSPVKERYRRIAALARAGEFDRLVSGRLIGVFSAWEMFKDHPVAGIGLGTYGYHFFPYRLEVQRTYAPVFRSGAEQAIFHDAHNDHLQVLATTGVAGYGLFVAAMALVASRSLKRRSEEDDEKARFARYAAFPLTACFAVSALAQFPLELAATVASYAFFAAVIFSWSPDAPGADGILTRFFKSRESDDR